jgi:osmoprotectant transport system substrate-binding protein
MKTRFAALVAAGVLALSACSSSAAGSTTLVVGSQQYYSNEIIAELYAQALEHGGYTITRQYQIGQREVYLPELQGGKIDVFPEYSGNLLQYLDKSATAKTGDEVIAALPKALGSSLRPLTASAATDQDSYNVTKANADKYGLASIADLSKVGSSLKVCANSELEKRPYGPTGLKNDYGLNVEVIPVEDSGGPLTVKALKDGKCDTAPKALILPQNVVPVVSAKVDEKAAAAIDKVSAALTTDELVGLNALSVNKQQSSSEIAKTWLTSKGLLG